MRVVPARSLLLAFVTIAVSGAVTVGFAATAAPPGPAVVSQAANPITVKAGDYSLITLTLDFAPGTATPKHYHGGPVVVTVLSGEITLQQGGTERVVKTGQSWTEKAGQVHAALNKGTEAARVSASLLIPKGEKATTVVK